MSTEVQNRVEAIRRKRAQEEEAKKNALVDQQITWEAEAILYVETIDVMKDLTDDIDVYTYVAHKLRIYEYKLHDAAASAPLPPPPPKSHPMMNMIVPDFRPRRRPMSDFDLNAYKPLFNLYHQNPDAIPKSDLSFKLKILLNKIQSVKESAEYKEKEITRKGLVEEERLVKEAILKEEQRVIKEQKLHEFNPGVQSMLNMVNRGINVLIKNALQHTFTNLTLAGEDIYYHDETGRWCWNAQSSEKNNHFLKRDGGNWYHFKVDYNSIDANKNEGGYIPCRDGTHPSFINFYEEGKVPFFTKCPTCNSPTKFHYDHPSSSLNQSSSFQKVYCDKGHYHYDCLGNNHCIATNSEISPLFNGKDLHMWKIWDPSDPDGAKARALAEKAKAEKEKAEMKKKEADDIQRQISELQVKLAALN